MRTMTGLVQSARLRRTLSCLLGAALLLFSGAWPAASGAAPVLIDSVVQSGLVHPWDLAFAPDGRLFVTEREGNLRIYASGEPSAPLLSNTRLAVHAQGEAGLMGVALDPDFAANGYLYVCASRDDESEWRNQVLRYVVTDNSIDSETFVIRYGMRAQPHHDGCR